MKTIEELEREIRILKKKLEFSKHREVRLCGDHEGKQIGNKTGCVACDVEYFTIKRIKEESKMSKVYDIPEIEIFVKGGQVQKRNNSKRYKC